VETTPNYWWRTSFRFTSITSAIEVVFNHELLELRPGYVLLQVSGKDIDVFRHEAGGQRWQRIPPTEKRGRVHTSTVTVAVLEAPKHSDISIPPQDLEESFVRGSGPGGQHRNKTATCVVLRHIPTGIRVRIDGGRSQHRNREVALEVLVAQLKQQQQFKQQEQHNQNRRHQIGSGQRGDKVRTIQVRNDRVVDHRTGKTTSFKRYRRGHLEDLI
jgi:peptide chain release factor 1